MIRDLHEYSQHVQCRKLNLNNKNPHISRTGTLKFS